MKLLSIFVLLFGLSAFADDAYTPEQQLCLNYNGQLKKLSIQYPRPQVLEFCYLGWAGMEVKTLDRSRLNTYGGPEANRAYRASNLHDFNACIKFSGQNYRAQAEGENRFYEICLFYDGSAIDNKTLEEGYTSPWNRQLNSVLGIF